MGRLSVFNLIYYDRLLLTALKATSSSPSDKRNNFIFGFEKQSFSRSRGITSARPTSCCWIQKHTPQTQLPRAVNLVCVCAAFMTLRAREYDVNLVSHIKLSFFLLHLLKSSMSKRTQKWFTCSEVLSIWCFRCNLSSKRTGWNKRADPDKWMSVSEDTLQESQRAQPTHKPTQNQSSSVSQWNHLKTIRLPWNLSRLVSVKNALSISSCLPDPCKSLSACL